MIEKSREIVASLAYFSGMQNIQAISLLLSALIVMKTNAQLSCENSVKASQTILSSHMQPCILPKTAFGDLMQSLLSLMYCGLATVPWPGHKTYDTKSPLPTAHCIDRNMSSKMASNYSDYQNNFAGPIHLLSGCRRLFNTEFISLQSIIL